MRPALNAATMTAGYNHHRESLDYAEGTQEDCSQTDNIFIDQVRLHYLIMLAIAETRGDHNIGTVCIPHLNI